MHAMAIFEWDTEKARSNLSKHGVAFDDAKLVWLDRFTSSIRIKSSIMSNAGTR
jgi:uncharacterized DUF497 family protein